MFALDDIYQDVLDTPTISYFLVVNPKNKILVHKMVRYSSGTGAELPYMGSSYYLTENT